MWWSEPPPEYLDAECPECSGQGYVVQVQPDCCGMAHELGYCRGDCAVPREEQVACPMCGGEGRVYPHKSE